MTVLYPSITEIEARWFEASDELLSRIAAGNQSVPEELQKAVENDTDRTGFVGALRNPEPWDVESSDKKPPVPEATTKFIEAPEWMTEWVTQKYATHQKYQNTPLSPGCIVSVNRLKGPEGECPLNARSDFVR